MNGLDDGRRRGGTRGARRVRAVALLVLGAVLGVVAVALGVYLSGRVVQLPRRLGEATSIVLRFDDPAAAPPPLAQPAGDGRARNLILILADGLGFSHLVAARIALVGIDGRLLVERLPVAGWLDTHAEGSVYTDSAASAAAMSSGRKTATGLLAISPQSEELETMAARALGVGMAVGLITDSYLWDATPAAFVVHGARRDFDNVAAQLAASGVAVLAGETLPDLELDLDDASPMIERFRAAGFTVARDAERWRAAVASAAPALGLFPPGTIAAADTAPQLADLAAAAIERLAAEPGGYFLMVETEEADTGAHYGDIDRVVGAVRALEAVLAHALDAARGGDTLVLVTSDHETGGLMLLGGVEGEPLRVRWGSRGHTAEPVPLFAYGPGAESLAGPRDNSALGRVLAELISAARRVPPSPAESRP